MGRGSGSGGRRRYNPAGAGERIIATRERVRREQRQTSDAGRPERLRATRQSILESQRRRGL